MRFFLLVLDGCGVGAMPDAAEYSPVDVGTNTLGHVAQAVGGLTMPVLESWGLGNITPLLGVAPTETPRASWGRLAEQSQGKDTVTGHWEMMGIVTRPGFPLYPDGFSRDVLDPLEEFLGCKTLGNYAASGTQIIQTLGEEHVKTGCPIVYTSADSVFQIAAHEDPQIFGLERLYAACAFVRKHSNICRVIARPFVGSITDGFTRTENRRDFPLVPSRNVVDLLTESGKHVHFIGKTCELFPNQARVTRELTTNNTAHQAALMQAAKESTADFIFANLEDFDMLYGHRNDPTGFARLLENFDAWLGQDFLPFLRPNDIVGITADHGNDPTTPSTDHSREYVPFLLYGTSLPATHHAQYFSDWGKIVCDCLGVPDSPLTTQRAMRGHFTTKGWGSLLKEV
jgi:phosphopentomutase